MAVGFPMAKKRTAQLLPAGADSYNGKYSVQRAAVLQYNVDEGVVEKHIKNSDGKQKNVQLEIDFVCNKARSRYYVQSAYSIPDNEKCNRKQQHWTESMTLKKKHLLLRTI